MNPLNKLYVAFRESRMGQSMTEYALIIAAVAVIAYVGYQALGTDINTVVNNIGHDL